MSQRRADDWARDHGTGYAGLSVTELCYRFAHSSDMFIRGVAPTDAMLLYRYGEQTGIGGLTAMERAIQARMTPDEWIEAQEATP